MLFIERILKLRQIIGKTRKDVAKDLNLAESTYGKYELGHRQPSLEILLKLANYFGVSTDYLLGLTSNPKPVMNENVEENREMEKLFRDLTIGEMKNILGITNEEVGSFPNIENNLAVILKEILKEEYTNISNPENKEFIDKIPNILEQICNRQNKIKRMKQSWEEYEVPDKDIDKLTVEEALKNVEDVDDAEEGLKESEVLKKEVETTKKENISKSIKTEFDIPFSEPHKTTIGKYFELNQEHQTKIRERIEVYLEDEQSATKDSSKVS